MKNFGRLIQKKMPPRKRKQAPAKTLEKRQPDEEEEESEDRTVTLGSDSERSESESDDTSLSGFIVKDEDLSSDEYEIPAGKGARFAAAIDSIERRAVRAAKRRRNSQEGGGA